MPNLSKSQVAAIVAKRSGNFIVKPSKYLNRKVKLDGYTFDSRKEAARWRELKVLVKLGTIRDLDHHRIYRIEINGVLVCKYEADFVYTDSGQTVVEDVKSAFTRKNPVYRLKSKLMFAVHGIKIVEV